MKPEINGRRITGKFTNTWKFIKTFLNNHWVKKDIKREIRKLLKTNKNITYKLWNEAKAVLGGKWVVMNTYIKKH